MNLCVGRDGPLTSLLLVLLLGSSAGCFSVRSTRPLTAVAPTSSPIPILPILASQVRITVEKAEHESSRKPALAESPLTSLDHVANLTNEILDDLTRQHGTFLGPSRVREALGKQALERLTVYLEDPGLLEEAWKTRGLAEIGSELFSDEVVRVRVQLLLQESSLDEVTDPLHAHWKGVAHVTMELLRLSPPAVLAQSNGEDHLSGNVGVIVAGAPPAAIAVPYAFGRGLGKSLDGATRSALSALLVGMKEQR